MSVRRLELQMTFVVQRQNFSPFSHYRRTLHVPSTAVLIFMMDQLNKLFSFSLSSCPFAVHSINIVSDTRRKKDDERCDGKIDENYVSAADWSDDCLRLERSWNWKC